MRVRCRYSQAPAWIVGWQTVRSQSRYGLSIAEMTVFAYWQEHAVTALYRMIFSSLEPITLTLAPL